MADEIVPDAGHGGTHPAASNSTDSRLKHERIDYRTGILSSPSEVPADEWNALLECDAQPTPFLRHEFLDALHVARCAVDDTGWSPHFVTLTDERTGRLAAAAPVYAKQHSYGEYVFDWAWADAYQRNNLPYYPKLLCAVPFTPVPGARLLAVDAEHRALLAEGLVQWCRQTELSSLHLLFGDDEDVAACEAAGLMLRHTVQFHWKNMAPAPPEGALAASGRPGGGSAYADFDAFLAALAQDKRKKIRQERRKVRDAGVTFRWARGADITEADWDFFYRCYARTYREHGNPPYLTRDFFRRQAQAMPEAWLLFTAERWRPAG